MAADMHIHVYEGLTEEDLARFFCHVMGSKWFDPGFSNQLTDHYQKIANTPSVWVGEVSWLKSCVFEDAETFVPNPVLRMFELVGEELPVIDDEFIAKAKEAFSVENQTEYLIAKWEELESFFLEHKGKQVFTVSW